MELLISYPWGHFYSARNEAASILKRLGDVHPQVEWIPLCGISAVHAPMGNRRVVTEPRELLLRI